MSRVRWGMVEVLREADGPKRSPAEWPRLGGVSPAPGTLRDDRSTIGPACSDFTLWAHSAPGVMRSTGARVNPLPWTALLTTWGEVVSDDGAALHYEFYGFQDADIGRGIARNRDDVGGVACFDGADFVGLADQVGGLECGGLDCVDGFHAPLHHLCELLRVVAVGIHAGVRTEGHLGDSGLPGVAEILALETADLLFFFDRFGEHARFRA